MMQRQLGLTAAIVTLLGAAACSNASAADKDLSRDLDLAAAAPATSSGLSLAPSAGRTEVVSTVERAPEAKAAPRPSAPQRAVVHHSPRQATLAATAPVAAPVAVVRAPEPVAAPDPAPIAAAEPAPQPRPTPAPTRQQEPRGGWRGVGEVIRNAPFPINP
ncbi:MAG: hypothetical protein ACR2M1_04130 [Gemmatimonadaceae bacterium]